MRANDLPSYIHQTLWQDFLGIHDESKGKRKMKTTRSTVSTSIIREGNPFLIVMVCHTWPGPLFQQDTNGALQAQQGVMSPQLQEEFINWLYKRRFSPKLRKKYFEVANKILTRVARKSIQNTK